MADNEKLDLGEEKAQGGGGSGKKIIFIVLGSVLLTLAIVFATLYFLGIFPPKDKPADPHAPAAAEHQEESHEPEHEAKPVIYLPLTPAFNVSFKNNPEIKVVQIEMNVASTDQAILDAVTKHAPMIRNNLLLMLGSQDPNALKTPEGKEALRGQIKEVIKKIIIEQTDKKVGVDEVYFTGFVMQ